MKSVFDVIIKMGHDMDFEPSVSALPTHHGPGSVGKIEVLADRVSKGLQLWNVNDADVFECPERQQIHSRQGCSGPRVVTMFPTRRKKLS